MAYWKLLLLKLVFFVIVVPLLGYALLRTVEFIQEAWKVGNRKKKWMAMCVIVGVYFILNGLFL